MKKLLVVFFILLLSVFNEIEVFAAVTWTTQTNSGQRNWHAITVSADGTKMAGVSPDPGAGIYTSADSGETWTQQLSTQGWFYITSSSDGAKLAAARYYTDGFSPSYIYTSTDSGETWTEQTGSGAKYWTSVAMSADGTKLAALEDDGYVHTSTDSGVTWTQQMGSYVSGTQKSNIVSSADGTQLAFISLDGGSLGCIFISTNSGVTWTEQTNHCGLGSYNAGLAMSSDGILLAAVDDNGGYIYTSTTNGETWDELTVLGTADWRDVAVSSDGSVIAATAYGGYIYLSEDYGSTWAEQTTAGVANWELIEMSSDGSVIAVTDEDPSGQYIHTGVGNVDVTPPTLVSFEPDDTSFSYEDLVVGNSYQFRMIFDENVQKGAGGLYIKRYSDDTTFGIIDITEFFSFGDEELYADFDTSDLDGSTLYYVTLNNSPGDSAVKDTAGNAFPEISNKDTWNFSTADNFAPVVSTLSPADNDTDVSTTANLTITFDEVVLVGSGNITIKKTSDNSTVETIDVTSGSVSGDASDTISINPSVTLESLTSYYIQIPNTAFRDGLGNYFSGIADTTSWNFTTADETPPTITSVSSDKTNGAYTTGEVIDIDVTFSEVINSAGNVTVTLETGDTDRTCTFTVSNSSTGTCNYTVQAGDTSSDLTVSSISGTIEDLAANAMSNFVPATNLAVNKALVIDTTVPTVSITAPTEGATVSGASVSITASASDTNLVGVQFKRDTNTNIGAEDTTSTYGVTWDTTLLSDGSQSLIAVARDTAGNYATSTAVSVTVDNVVDSSPSGSGGGRSSSVTSSCTPSDRTVSVGDKVSFDIDIDTTEDSYEFKWTKVLSGDDEDESYRFTEEGKFYPRAEAKDSAGNKTTVNCGTITVESDNDTEDNDDTEEQDNNDYLYKLVKQFESDLRFLMRLGIELPNKIIEILNDFINNNSSTFTRDLELGMEGEDVKQLQIFLNNNGYTVSTQGPGSPNNETTRFGYAAQSALINFQKANNITPALGYFGPVTRNVVTELLE